MQINGSVLRAYYVAPGEQWNLIGTGTGRRGSGTSSSWASPRTRGRADRSRTIWTARSWPRARGADLGQPGQQAAVGHVRCQHPRRLVAELAGRPEAGHLPRRRGLTESPPRSRSAARGCEVALTSPSPSYRWELPPSRKPEGSTPGPRPGVGPSPPGSGAAAVLRRLFTVVPGRGGCGSVLTGVADRGHQSAHEASPFGHRIDHQVFMFGVRTAANGA